MRAQLELMGDDGLLVPRDFPAIVFAGRGFKSLFKLQHDEKRLRAMLAGDAEVVFVGRFKESKRGRAADGEHTLSVTSFSAMERAAAPSEPAEDAEDALAVYPQRCVPPLHSWPP